MSTTPTPPEQPAQGGYPQNPPPPYGLPPYGGGYPQNPPPAYGGYQQYTPGGPAGYGPPPPGYYPYPPAPPARKRGLPWWAWLIIGVVLVSVLACAGGIYFAINFGLNSKAEGERVVDRYIKAAAARDYDQLFALSDSTNRGTFRTQVDTQVITPYAAILPDYERLSSGPYFSVKTLNNRTTMNISGDAFFRTGKGAFAAELLQAGDSWKVVNLELQEPKDTAP